MMTDTTTSACYSLNYSRILYFWVCAGNLLWSQRHEQALKCSANVLRFFSDIYKSLHLIIN